MKKQKVAARPGYVYATKKGKRATAWMPTEVVLMLDGEPKGKLLMICGWTLSTRGKDYSKACKAWPIARLEKALDQLKADWADDISKGWKLEVRPT